MWTSICRFKTGGWVKECVGFTAILVITSSFSLLCHAGGDLMRQPAIKTQRAATSPLLDVANAGMRFVAVGDRGHIVYSDDHGKSWSQADVPVSVTLTAVYFPSPKKGWAVGHEGVVLHTTDGGKTWTKQLDGFQANDLDVMLFQNLVKEKAAEVDQAPEEQKETMEQELEVLQIKLEDLQFEKEQGAWKPFLDVWFENDQSGFVVGAFGYIFQTGDGGRTWRSVRNRIHNPDNYHLKCIARIDGALIVAGEAGILYRSMDRGQSFHPLESPTEQSFFGLTASTNLIVAVSFKGAAYWSVDLGESWQLLKTGIQSTLADGTVLSDGSIAIVSYGGDLLRVQRNSQPKISVQNLKGRGMVAVAETQDGSLVTAGMTGVHRTQMK